MNKDKDNQEVSDHGEPCYEEELEKMKRSSYDDNNKVVITAQKNSSGEVAMHECNLCDKTFKNGKALGGHRRSHFQAAKVKFRFSNHLKTTSTNNNNMKTACDEDDGGDDGDNDGKHTCYLCKKYFPSNHSLYGHMRSHPERLWRGVYPPIHSNHNHNNIKHSSSSSRSSDLEYDYDDYDEFVAPEIDISKSSSLPRWQKTGKRGRKSTSVYEAAENLVLLSMRYNNFFATKSTVVEPKSPQPPIISCKIKNIGEASTSENHAPKKIKFYVSDSLRLGNQNDGCDSDKVNKRGGNLSELKNERVSVHMDCKEEVEKDSGSMNIKEAMQDHNFDERKTMMKNKKVKKLSVKKRKGRDSESEDKSFLCNETIQKKVNGYECDICWKSFPTFQGLGGHRSIHNKEKKNDMNMAESKPSDHAIADDATLRGLVMEEANDEVQTKEDASLSQFLGPNILDFDLNMPPDDMHG